MTFRKFSKLGKEVKIIKYIAANLSEINRIEAALWCPDSTVEEALMEQAKLSEKGFVLYANTETAEPCGIGGVLPNGQIWFVITEDAPEKMQVSWFKHTKKWLAERMNFHHRISGLCWEHNTLAMKWMRFMGFEFADITSEATQEVAGEKFLYFTMN